MLLCPLIPENVFNIFKLNTTQTPFYRTNQPCKNINTGLAGTQKWAIYYQLGRRREGRREEGKEGGGHPPAFWRKTSWGQEWWDGEKWPFMFDGNESEAELTVIQTAFRADPRLGICHAGRESGELGGHWPLPTGPLEKKLCRKETLHT